MSNRHRVIGARALLLGTLASPGVANAVLTLPGGDTQLDGSFFDLHYGATGNAFVTPLLHVSELGGTLPVVTQVQGTELAFNYGASGLGTSLFRIDYTLRNNSGASVFSNLRFMLNVQVDGSSTFTDNVLAIWGAKAAQDPDGRQVAIYNPANTLLDQMQTTNGVADGVNECIGPCDADFGLQWNQGQLLPGQTWSISVALSDGPGVPPSQRFLRAVSADTANTMLTISAVPEPSAYLMFAAGLGVLLGVRRLRQNAV